MTKPKLVTIGVYGFTEDAFFHALLEAGVDVFCDVRMRRGLRGHEYAFANSKYLQERLQELGIDYIYLKELAPTPEIRELQVRHDKKTGTRQRDREGLCPEFVAAYSERVNAYDAKEIIDRMPDGAETIAFFCVEENPKACHRSLLADKLARELGLPREDIVPPE